MNIQEPDAHEFHTRWYKCTLALCFDCRRICGSVDAFDSRAQLSHESTHEQALGSSRKQTAVLTLCRAARNLLLNSGTRANRAAEKPDPSPQGAAARPQAQSPTCIDLGFNEVFLRSTPYRITRDFVPSKYRTDRFSAIQSCMRSSTNHCVNRLTLE